MHSGVFNKLNYLQLYVFVQVKIDLGLFLFNLVGGLVWSVLLSTDMHYRSGQNVVDSQGAAK